MAYRRLFCRAVKEGHGLANRLARRVAAAGTAARRAPCADPGASPMVGPLGPPEETPPRGLSASLQEVMRPWRPFLEAAAASAPAAAPQHHPRHHRRYFPFKESSQAAPPQNRGPLWATTTRQQQSVMIAPAQRGAVLWRGWCSEGVFQGRTTAPEAATANDLRSRGFSAGATARGGSGGGEWEIEDGWNVEDAFRSKEEAEDHRAAEEVEDHHPAAEDGMLVTVHFTGTLEDGTIFASTSEDFTTTSRALHGHATARRGGGKLAGPPTSSSEEVASSAAAAVAAGMIQGGQPLKFTLGKGEVLPGVDRGVQGMRVGETKEVSVEPREGFGEHEEKLLMTNVPVDQLPDDAQEEGGLLQVVDNSLGGKRDARVTKVEGGLATVDLNHPLAGKRLTFSLHLVACEAAAASSEAGRAPPK